MSTWADHLHHLKPFSEELMKAGLTTNLYKCHLGLTESQYLRFCISQGLLNPQEKKTKAVQEYILPTAK